MGAILFVAISNETGKTFNYWVTTPECKHWICHISWGSTFVGLSQKIIFKCRHHVCAHTEKKELCCSYMATFCPWKGFKVNKTRVASDLKLPKASDFGWLGSGRFEGLLLNTCHLDASLRYVHLWASDHWIAFESLLQGTVFLCILTLALHSLLSFIACLPNSEIHLWLADTPHPYCPITGQWCLYQLQEKNPQDHSFE